MLKRIHLYVVPTFALSRGHWQLRAAFVDLILKKKQRKYKQEAG